MSVAGGFWFSSDHNDADEALHELPVFTMAAYQSWPSFPDIFGEAIGEGTMLIEGRNQIVGPTDFETRFGPTQAIQDG